MFDIYPSKRFYFRYFGYLYNLHLQVFSSINHIFRFDFVAGFTSGIFNQFQNNLILTVKYFDKNIS